MSALQAFDDEKLLPLQNRVQSLFPRCALVGNYLTGISRRGVYRHRQNRCG
jgi:hypothetical protein